MSRNQEKVQGTVLPAKLSVGWFVWEGTHGRSGSTNLVEELKGTRSNFVVILTLPAVKKDGCLAQKGEDAFRTANGTSVAEIMMDVCDLPLVVICPMDIGYWDEITPSMASNAAVRRPQRNHCHRYLPSIEFMKTFGVLVECDDGTYLQRSGLFVVKLEYNKRPVIERAWIPRNPLELPTRETLNRLL